MHCFCLLDWSPYWNIRHFKLVPCWNIRHFGLVAILECPPYWIKYHLEFTIILQFDIHFNVVESLLVGRYCIPDPFRLSVNYVCLEVSMILCSPDFWVFIKILVDILALIFMFASFKVFRLSLVYIVIPDQWQRAMVYFWNWIAVFVPGAGKARGHESINWDLRGEVRSATRRGMQPYCVKFVLYEYSMMNEWIVWMNEWMNGVMNGWVVWWMDE